MAGRISWNGSFAGQHTSDFSEFSNNVRDFRQLIIRPHRSVAIDGEGRVFYFNQAGQHASRDWKEVPNLPEKAVQIVSTLDTVYILTEGGNIYATNALGLNFYAFHDELRAEKLAATQHEIAMLHENDTISILSQHQHIIVPAAMRIPNELNRNIVDIVAGDEHFLALTEDG